MARPAGTYYYNDREWTVKEIAVETGLTIAQIYSRLEHTEVRVLFTTTHTRGYDLFGMHFDTKTQIAKHFDISYPRLLERLKIGMTVEEAVCVPIRTVKYTKSWEYKGEIHTNLSALCRKLGVSVSSISHQLRKGMTLEEAVDYTPTKANKSWEYQGEIHTNLSALCRKLGISRNKINNVLLKGLSLDEAIQKIQSHSRT